MVEKVMKFMLHFRKKVFSEEKVRGPPARGGGNILDCENIEHYRPLIRWSNERFR